MNIASTLRRGGHVLALATALALTNAATTPGAQTTGRSAAPAVAAAPRLLVILVVDQFRADYVSLYGARWTQGLHRLLTDGATFPQAAMPYAITKTCAGHASIGTGTVPATHGLIDNDWYDLTSRAFVTCTADPSARAIAFAGERGAEHHSAASLRASTLGDVLLRTRRSSRVVSLALKARSAIGLGGHGGPGAMIAWEEDSGAWASSSAFTETPWPEIDAFVRAHDSRTDRGQSWTRALPLASYLYADRSAGEPFDGVFPHVLNAPFGASFAAVWDASPRSDAYLADMATALVTSKQLGQRTETDLLAIGFSALDYIGHAYGPRSHEVQDALARLDTDIGGLLTSLDRAVGRDRYVVALTSDHGVAPLPEQAQEMTGAPGGRLNLNTIGMAVDVGLGGRFGRQAIASISGTYVYLMPGVLDRVHADASTVRGVEASLRSVPGIEKMYWAWDLAARTPTTDETLAMLRRSYVPGRSGDIAFVPKPNWVAASAGTNHGSPHPYDTRVPLAFLGAGIKPGSYSNAASPVDVAPTLAALAGLRLPNADGRVLTEALAR